jgi:hypothetical protein
VPEGLQNVERIYSRDVRTDKDFDGRRPPLQPEVFAKALNKSGKMNGKIWRERHRQHAGRVRSPRRDFGGQFGDIGVTPGIGRIACGGLNYCVLSRLTNNYESTDKP